MRVEDLTGGTNSPGVPAAAFAMPPGTAIRYDVPAAQLRPYLTGYAVYGATSREPMLDCFLPAPPMLCVLVDAGPVTVQIRRHSFVGIPDVALYGPSSRGPRVTTTGGINVGIGLTALGWAKLTALPADRFHNRVVALSDVVDASLAKRLRAGLNDVRRDADMPGVIDHVLADAFSRYDEQEELIGALSTLLTRDGLIVVAELAELMALSSSALRRLARTKFGLPPKVLLRRSRFLRSYARLKVLDDEAAITALDSSYHDWAHFLRDAQTFLGATPRQMEREGTLFLTASLRARAATLGAPAHALHREQ